MTHINLKTNTKRWTIRTSPTPGCELRWSEMISSSCLLKDTRRMVNFPIRYKIFLAKTEWFHWITNCFWFTFATLHEKVHLHLWNRCLIPPDFIVLLTVKFWSDVFNQWVTNFCLRNFVSKNQSCRCIWLMLFLQKHTPGRMDYYCQ